MSATSTTRASWPLRSSRAGRSAWHPDSHGDSGDGPHSSLGSRAHGLRATATATQACLRCGAPRAAPRRVPPSPRRARASRRRLLRSAATDTGAASRSEEERNTGGCRRCGRIGTPSTPPSPKATAASRPLKPRYKCRTSAAPSRASRVVLPFFAPDGASRAKHSRSGSAAERWRLLML